MAEQEVLSGYRTGQSRLAATFKRISDRTPLRTKLITAVLTLVILAIAAIGVASTYMLRTYVLSQHDRDLQSAMNYEFVARGGQLPGEVGPGTAAPTQSNIIEGLQVPGHQLTWGVFNNLPQGMGSTDPLPRLPSNGLWAGSAVGSTVGPVSLPAQSGTHTWRVLARTVLFNGPGGQTKETFVVAEDIGNINALTTRLILFDLIVGGSIILFLAAVGAGVVQANLRPLNDIELTAGQIAAGHLDHRVPEGDPRTEIGSLSRSLNAMLSHIERAFHAQGQAEQAAHQSEERMRRFIADAAHELRTPLTTIRGFAAHYRQRGGAGRMRPAAPGQGGGSGSPGTALAGPRTAVTGTGGESQDQVSATAAAFSGTPGSASGGAAPEGLSPEELDRLMGRVESEATRMGVLVEDLLTLARLDQQRPLASAPVDLLTLAADAVQDARVTAPGRPIELTVAPGTAFLIEGDESRLRQVLANLVNNAITHTPAGTRIRVKISRGTLDAGPGAAGAAASGEAVPAVLLDVEDDGPGMTADQAQRVFERFYRADAARNRASGGTGLGLAIVASLVAAHGGTVSVRTAPGRGADFQVRLPLSPDALASDDDADADDDDLPA